MPGGCRRHDRGRRRAGCPGHDRPGGGLAAQLAGRALAAVDAELALLDEQASRFRDDSEISLVQRFFSAATRPGSARPGDAPPRGSCIVSEGLAEAIAVALAAAEWTGGLVDPTVGGALHGLGYDRDFAALPQGAAGEAAPPEPGYVPGWQSVRLDGRRLRLAAWSDSSTSEPPPKASAPIAPPGRQRTACPAAACWSASAATSPWRERRRWAAGRCLSATSPSRKAESLPFAVPGRCAPRRSRRASRSGWPRVPWRPRRSAAVSGGGAAAPCITSWTRGPACLPRGRGGSASVAAANCAEANAAATAAIVAGEQAAGWLTAQGLPARLVAHDGSVCLLGGWPATARWAGQGARQPADAGRSERQARRYALATG